jgi:hypothetical protein
MYLLKNGVHVLDNIFMYMTSVMIYVIINIIILLIMYVGVGDFVWRTYGRTLSVYCMRK